MKKQKKKNWCDPHCDLNKYRHWTSLSASSSSSQEFIVQQKKRQICIKIRNKNSTWDKVAKEWTRKIYYYDREEEKPKKARLNRCYRNQKHFQIYDFGATVQLDIFFFFLWNWTGLASVCGNFRFDIQRKRLKMDSSFSFKEIWNISYI